MTKRLVAAAAALVALVLALTTLVDNGPDHPPAKPPAPAPKIGDTTKVDNADADAKPNDVVELTPKAQDVAEELVKHPGDLKPDKPNAAPLKGTGKQIAPNVIPAPLAADEIAGCRTRFLKVNFSSRGVTPDKVVLFELHYTAGPDIPNSRADVDGLTAFGNQASSRVSWHFNMDKDGNCDYNVPLRLKSWTIANLNPYTINIEVAGKGEAPYLRPAGYRKLASIIRQVRQAYPGIKLRLGASDGHCHPTLGGIDSHYRGGPCSGGHSDIKPLDLASVINTIRRYSRPPGPPASVVTDCRHVARWRARYPRGRGSSPSSRSHIRGHLRHARMSGWDCPSGSSKPHRL